MKVHRYQIGDRVQLIHPYFGLPAGSQGLVTFIYSTTHNLYRVYFDTAGIALTLHCSTLAEAPLSA